MAITPNPRVASYPLISNARDFLKLMNGQSSKILRDMMNTIQSNIGSKDESNDWSRPDEWIDEILKGDERKLAVTIWEGSNKSLSPRYVYNTLRFCTVHDLINEDTRSIFHVTEAGTEFLDGKNVTEIDYIEGIINLIATVADYGPARRGSLLPPFSNFLRDYSDIKSKNTIGVYWYSRMLNVVDREFVQRTGHTYQITDKGLKYIETATKQIETTESSVTTKPITSIRQLSTKQEQEVRNSLKIALEVIDPYDFEQFVKYLLQTMGYENVEVTTKSNDGGVDVIADIEVGITSIREVVQVKRFKGTVGRPVLDQLRGSLHRYDALQGTIITTGRFSKDAQAASFERGAAPITLIDGERLIQLLIDNGIGVEHEEIKVIKFNPNDFEFGNEGDDDSGT